MVPDLQSFQLMIFLTLQYCESNTYSVEPVTLNFEFCLNFSQASDMQSDTCNAGQQQ